MCACWQQITILESLVYSARLRFGKEVERHVVYAFVQEVRSQMWVLVGQLESSKCAVECKRSRTRMNKETQFSQQE